MIIEIGDNLRNLLMLILLAVVVWISFRDGGK